MNRFHWLSTLDRFFEQLSRWHMALLCMLFILILGIFDYQIRPHASEDLFYAIVIVVSAWYGGRWMGSAMAVLSALAWFFANLDSGFSAPLVGFIWNTFSMMIVYLLMAFIMAILKNRIVQLDELASQDALTGLLNRRAMYRLVSLEAARSNRNHNPYTIAYLDVDDFKKVNDTLGHEGGDRMLQTIAHTLKQNVRQNDLVARMGGDEFVLLFPDSGPQQGQKALEKLFQILNEKMRQSDCPVTFSIGALSFNDNPCPVDEMINRADQLMYEIKNGLKNGIRFEVDCSCKS